MYYKEEELSTEETVDMLNEEVEILKEKIELLTKVNRKMLDTIAMVADNNDDLNFNFERLKDLFLDLLNKEGYIIDIEPAVPAKEEVVYLKKQKASNQKAKSK
jgi:predicted regulator of amino acid metabolism with ACT domain